MVIDRERLLRLLLRGALALLISAVLAAPLAIAWGIGQADITDYLGANRTRIAVDYTGETQIDLGPLGNAYLPLSYGPIGLTITVGGIVTPSGGGTLLSSQTLQSYLNLYNDPSQAVQGIADELIADAVGHAVVAEVVLVLIMLGWTQRRWFLSSRLVRMSRARHGVLAYLMSLIITLTVVIAPPATDAKPRYPVTIAEGTRFAGMTVDSQLLADLLDRGVRGLQTLADRQNAAVETYVKETTKHLRGQRKHFPDPAPNEELIFGISDLHCNLAMTRIWKELVAQTHPVAMISSGDDTLNGTATEKTCVTGERAIAPDIPFVDIGGNHDSATTEQQMKAAGATVLDGKVTEVNGIRYLGDDDPEYNPPFSTTRVQERSETEQQLGERMAKTAAGRNVDILMLHQPDAAKVVAEKPNPPAKLIIWGHMHVQEGPQVVLHDDGSWSVVLQLGTAGGVAAPTITSFSTPFSPPRKSADAYFFYRDKATGLITAVQPVHCMPDSSVIIDDKIPTGDLATLPPETRGRLGGADEPPTASPTPETPAASSSHR